MPSYYFYPSSSLRLGIVITEQSRKAFKIAPLWLKNNNPSLKEQISSSLLGALFFQLPALRIYNLKKRTTQCSTTMEEGVVHPVH